MAVRCTCGAELKGTLERISGVAIATFSRNADSSIEVEHLGDTEIYWDEQKTVTRGGRTVFVCESGCEILEHEAIDEDELEEAEA